MPYSIAENRADCAGYAVIKDDDNDLMGCHRTRAQAEAQLAALRISENDDDDDDDIEPVDDDENLANEVGMRHKTPNADAAREILASIRHTR
jgi:hypothetical protein